MSSTQRGTALRCAALALLLVFGWACRSGDEDDSDAEPLEIEVTVEEPIDSPGLDEL